VRKVFSTLIITPLLLCWSLVYGVLGGMFFQLLAVFEHLLVRNRQQLMTWKRYPQRSDREYAALLLEQQMRQGEVGNLPFVHSQAEASGRAPFPLLTLLSNTLLALLWLPVAMLRGAIKGPVYVYTTSRRRLARLLAAEQE
jgi:uncharacterized protein YneF (UPF0154 family)